MNFGDRFYEIVRRLGALREEEQALTHELYGIVGKNVKAAAKAIDRAATTANMGVKVKAAKGKPKQKGQLQKLVLQVLGTYKTAKSVAEIAAKVAKTRAGTTQASVATVLHGLAKRGIVLKPEPGTFYLPEQASVPAPVAPVAAPVADEVLES